MSSVSVVIPNYNGAQILPRCLPPTLTALRADAPGSEVVIVDDASTDGGPEWIRRHHPEVRLLTNPENLGFGATVNRGVEAARHRFVVLLNTDVEVRPGLLPVVLPHFEDSSVFAVTFRAELPDGRFREGPNRVVFKTGLPHTYHDPEDAITDDRGRILATYPVGGHCVVRRDRFLDLGGFRRLYDPFYWEDADLGLRARARGWVTVYEPRARVIHLERGVIRTAFAERTIRRIKLRNRFLVAWNAFPPRTRLLRHPLVAVRFLEAVMRGNRDFFAAFAEARRRQRAYR